MTLKLSDTLTRQLREFVPLTPGKATLYTCGPTVHDFAHIGNFRTFTVYDLLRRALKRAGLEVLQLMNLTDIEDRIIAKAGRAGVSITEFTRPYIEAFHAHRRALRIEDAEVYPLATEHIPEMIALIEQLERRGHTYRADGSLYYRISSFPDYGKLSKKDLAGQRAGTRIDADDYDKEEALDFVLWKAAKPGEPSWTSPFGPGRPGWHIECSAMATRYLGASFDIHAGGIDLIFPHHENEIAQSEGASGAPFARYWLHAEFLNVQTESLRSEKMSKRLGNFQTVEDVIRAGIDPRWLRYFYLTTHYRKPMALGADSLDQARSAVQRLDNTLGRLDSEARSGPATASLAAASTRALSAFDAAIGDDLNTPEALAALHGFLGDCNAALDRAEVSQGDASEARATLTEIDQVLAVVPALAAAAPDELVAIIRDREQARGKRDFAAADRLRQRATDLGYALEDVKGGGTRYKRL